MIGFGSDKDERGAEREEKERWRLQGSRLPACGCVEGVEGLWAPQCCFD